MSTTFSIGHASSSSGLSPDALRYYEHEGIIGPFERDRSNRRRFDDTDIAWIGVVTCMRDAGLGIAELRAFASLLRGSDTSTDPVVFLQDRRAALTARAALLQTAIGVLDDKIAYFAEAAAASHRTSRVHVHGELRCHDDEQLRILHEHLPEHVRLTRAEPGCISFEVTHTDDPRVWHVEEWFENRAAFAAHQARTSATEWSHLSSPFGHDYEITDG